MNIPYQILELEPEPLLILTRNEMENHAVLASVLDEMVPSSLSAVNNILLLAARWLQTATWQSQVWLLTVERGGTSTPMGIEGIGRRSSPGNPENSTTARVAARLDQGQKKIPKKPKPKIKNRVKKRIVEG